MNAMVYDSCLHSRVVPSVNTVSIHKQRVAQRVAERRNDLIALSRQVHGFAETAWQEYESSQAVSEFLSKEGFAIEIPYLDLPTAFRATYRPSESRGAVGFIAEYDALPGMGHACGHNLISAMSVGAAQALLPAAEEYGFEIQVIGTPAEEGKGGKIELLDRGAFADLGIALMAHPGPEDVVEISPLAVSHLEIEFHGKAAHAGAFPMNGRNAADAMVIAQTAIGMLRQQLSDGVRIHGVVTNGGASANAIPDLVAGRWYVRAASTAQLLEVEGRVRKCFEAGAHATGCEVSITLDGGRYAEFNNCPELAGFYGENIQALNRVPSVDSPGSLMASSASTDMGNVSQVVPSLHPYIGLNCYPVVNHQAEFAEAAISDAADKVIVDGAIALAWTALDWFHAHGR